LQNVAIAGDLVQVTCGSRFSTRCATRLDIRQLNMSRVMMSTMKRKAEKPVSPPKTKKPKIVVPEYHLTPSRQDEAGIDVWPARVEQIEKARDIIREWSVSIGKSI
jgi:hypothetical protein